MASPDMDVIKEIPGYKVILKAILKSQIQQLVEQLAAHTEEESIILTASVSDGTLSHLGSESGKSFLEDHEDVKSQFLGFCLKFQHKKKQLKEKQQQEEEQRKQMLAQQQQQQQQQFSPRGPGFMARSPRMQYSPRFSPRHMMRSPGNRQEPYPVSRPIRRPPLNLGAQGRAGASPGSMRLPLGNNQVIKIEPEDPESESSQGASEVNTGQDGSGDMSAPNTSSQPSSPSRTTPSNIKSESTERDDDKSNSSTSTIPNEASEMRVSDSAPQEGLSFDSDLSGLASSDPTAAKTGSEGGAEGEINIKMEAITESEMELEITGVEPGRNVVPTTPTAGPSSQDSWAPSVQQYGIAESRGGDMQGSGPGYSIDSTFFPEPEDLGKQIKPYRCSVCNKMFASKYTLKTHFRLHTGEKPYKCSKCGKMYSDQSNFNKHSLMHNMEELKELGEF